MSLSARRCRALVICGLMIGLIPVSGCTTGVFASKGNQRGDEVVSTISPAPVEPLMIRDGPLLPLLDVNVVIFDVGQDAAEDEALMAVRKLESRLLPGLLREALVRSDQWGAVRVVPNASALAPVNIQATILVSDGRDLTLDVRVSDVTGEEWFELQLAETQAQETEADNFAGLSNLFYVVSNRMRKHWLSRSEEQRARLISTADILYARELAPDVFADYVDSTSPTLTLKREPAKNEPMLGRVRRIKNQEYLFCDAIDEQLGNLLELAGPTYLLWRQAAIEQANWLDHYESMAASRTAGQSGGAFSRMQASYAAYRSYRVQEQALLELAEALEGESEPVVLSVEDAVFTLEGTLEAQYATWRELLQEIFLLERGGPL